MENAKFGSCPFCGHSTLEKFGLVDVPQTKRVYDLKTGDEFKMWGVFVSVVRVGGGKLFYRYLYDETQDKHGAKPEHFIGAKGQYKVEIR